MAKAKSRSRSDDDTVGVPRADEFELAWAQFGPTDDTREVFREAPSKETGSLAELLNLPKLAKGKQKKILRLVSQEVFADLQATKFDPTYTSLWGKLQQEFGRDELRGALERLRRGADRDGGVERALRRLASFPTLGYFGPVDPAPEAHAGLPDLRLWRKVSTAEWVLPYLGLFDPRGVAFRGETRPFQMDLATPLTVLELGFSLQYALAPVPKTRVQARMPWKGREGWEAAFWLLRQTKLYRRRRKRADHVRAFIDKYGRVHSKAKKDPKRERITPESTVNTLLRAARERVAAISETVQEDTEWLHWAEDHLLSGQPLSRSEPSIPLPAAPASTPKEIAGPGGRKAFIY